ncbi:MAG: DUF1330 domain-containing protein [Alphaproteobacteria bacterium]
MTDEARYRDYVAANVVAFEKYNAKILVRGGTFETPECQARGRNVVIEFPSYQAALASYHSPEYAKAKSHCASAAVSELIIIEGHET